MNENIQKMLELLSQDEEAMKKLSAIRDPDEAYALVTSIHGGYTKEEFIEAMTELNDSINQDIDADDLSKAAGGEKAKISGKEGLARMGSILATAAGSYFGTAALASLSSAVATELATAVSGAAATAAV